MKIAEKLANKSRDHGAEGVTIAFLGDSVTQGCFEIYRKNGEIETVYDKKSGYQRHLFDILALLYPDVTVNIINAGISGANADHSRKRLERDVIMHRPDMCVVSFGSNDMQNGDEGLESFKASLTEIVTRLKDAEIEVLVLSAPMNCTKVGYMLKDEKLREIAARVADKVNSGVLKRYAAAAGEVAKECGVAFVDAYARWERLYLAGVDTDALLENHINHPNGEMHKATASWILDRMLDD